MTLSVGCDTVVTIRHDNIGKRFFPTGDCAGNSFRHAPSKSVEAYGRNREGEEKLFDVSHKDFKDFREFKEFIIIKAQKA